MSRNIRLGLATVSAAAATLAAGAPSAMGIDGVGAPLPVAAPVQVQTPAAPTLPAAPALPAAPVRAPQAPQAPPAPSAPPAPRLPVVTTVVAASGSAAGSVGRSPLAVRGSPSRPAGSAAAPAGRSGAAQRRSRAKAIAETRRLRAEVKRLRGCLGVLPELARHLIEMRAGIDGPALTRRAAAKELRITVGRAHRMERRGLRVMRRASSDGRCGARPAPSHAVQTFGLNATGNGPSALASAVSVASPPAAAATPPARPQAKQRPRQAVLGVHESSPQAQRLIRNSRVAAAEPKSGRGLVVVLVLLLLTANLLATAVWLLRRRAERRGPFVVEIADSPSSENVDDGPLYIGPVPGSTPGLAEEEEKPEDPEPRS